MILDALWLFTGGSGAPGNNDGLTDSPTTGTQNSSNVVDLGGPALPPSVASPAQPGRDLGIGDDPALKLMVVVTTAFTVGTSLQIGVQGAPDNGSGAPGTYQTMASGEIVTTANLTIGSRLFDIDFPRTGPLNVAPPRFIRLSYVSGGTFTLGKIEGLFVLDRFDQIEHTNAVLSGYPAGIYIAN
jgi:hypothetical protein